MRLVLLFLFALLLASCAGQPKKSASTSDVEPQDGPSMQSIRPEDVRDAVPRREPLASYGNHSPYEVFGRKYHVLPSSDGYRERGVASWYGSKFHGRRTSSGEPYDMHLATAAHKSLPLPTYAEVTNLENGRRVIVKINDRGPFKDDRIIDMSYGAALRLGMMEKGTAQVEVRAIDTRDLPAASQEELRLAGAAPDVDATYLQMGAYGQRDSAERLAGQLEGVNLKPVSIHQQGELFRVWVGPYFSSLEINEVIQRAIELGFERPHRVQGQTVRP